MGRHAHVARCRVREVTGFSSWPISDPLDFLPVDGFFFCRCGWPGRSTWARSVLTKSGFTQRARTSKHACGRCDTERENKLQSEGRFYEPFRRSGYLCDTMRKGDQLVFRMF
jgi:hypothetical protein